MPFNLPVEGEENWDDKLNESIQFVKTTADNAQSTANTASTNASSAVTTANQALTTAQQALDVANQGGGVTSVAGKTGAVTLVKNDVGLGNVDNTTDLAKPVSTATQTAINNAATTAANNLAAHTGNVANPHAVTKAQVGLGNVDNTSDANKPISTAVANALAALTTRSLADVSDATPADGNFHEYDADTGQWIAVDPTSRFVAADPSTGKTLTSKAAPFTLFGFIVDEGAPPPSGLPLGLGVPIIGFSRAAAPSMVPILLDDNFAQNSPTVTLTLPEQLAVGDKIGIAIGYSNEAGVNSFTVAYSAGAGAPTFSTISGPNATAGCVQAQAQITTLVPSGATITITCKDATNVNSNRVHFFAAVYRLPNITSTTPLDQQATGGGNSTSTMTALACGPTSGDTTQPNEVAIGLAVWNSGAGTVSRTLEGTNGWQLVSQQESDNGTSARSLAVFYKVLTSIQKPQLTTLMTSSDGSTGQWATELATYKGV